MPEQCVKLILKLSDDNLGNADERMGMYEIEDALESAIDTSGVGEYDGHEFGGGECVFYMYGEDADKLHGAIQEPLKALKAKIEGRGQVIKRYGPPEEGIREEKIVL